MWKRVETKSQRVLGASFYVCRGYRGKTAREGNHLQNPFKNELENGYQGQLFPKKKMIVSPNVTDKITCF